MNGALTMSELVQHAMSKHPAADAAELRRTVALRRLPVDQFHRNPEPLLLMLANDDIMNLWSAKVDGQRQCQLCLTLPSRLTRMQQLLRGH